MRVGMREIGYGYSMISQEVPTITSFRIQVQLALNNHVCAHLLDVYCSLPCDSRGHKPELSYSVLGFPGLLCPPCRCLMSMCWKGGWLCEGQVHRKQMRARAQAGQVEVLGALQGQENPWLLPAMTDIYLRTHFFSNVFIFIAFKEINVHKILRGACSLQE